MISLQKYVVFKDFRQTKHPIFQDRIKSQNDLLVTKIKGNKTTPYQIASPKIIKSLFLFYKMSQNKWIIN